MRQDVDRLPENSLQIARIQNEMGIQTIYYFRSVDRIFNPSIIEELAGLGHEVGYHYEDLSLVSAKLKTQGKGNRARGKELEKVVVEEGIESFSRNLEKFREIVPVRSICMHGSPLSKWDSRLLWKYYDYIDFAIDSEPYFDINFENRLYLTDTGRRWNGERFSVRDKVIRPEDDLIKEGVLYDPYVDWKHKPISGSLMNMTNKAYELQNGNKFKSTSDIIKAADQGALPMELMITSHPHRWSGSFSGWLKELVWQNSKNIVKYFIIRWTN